MRYDSLYHLIQILKPSNIVEIGTWNGGNAVNMIKASGLEHVWYTGFDLFEQATEQTDSDELNVKPHNNVETVRKYIIDHTNAYVHLIKGNTRQTLLPNSHSLSHGQDKADFVFLDGGHSIETIASDYEAVKYSKVIVFDDYYIPDAEGRIPDLTKYGCNSLVDKLPHVLFGSADPVKGGGLTRLALVLGNAN